MTTINCTSNCIYQENGKCALQNVQAITSSCNDDCAYFISKKQKENRNTP
ncbi:hydroxymyristoyl-ACP dehydratase [Alkalibaculum bacchi]|nr:hydroxymyristoyl-ACP dehydratase [Alkalibaculum bacchi]